MFEQVNLPKYAHAYIAVALVASYVVAFIVCIWVTPVALLMVVHWFSFCYYVNNNIFCLRCLHLSF